MSFESSYLVDNQLLLVIDTPFLRGVFLLLNSGIQTAVMRKLFLLITGALLDIASVAQTPESPDRIYGALFHDVQMSRVFPMEKPLWTAFPNAIRKK
jgi:hypothetical protein